MPPTESITSSGTPATKLRPPRVRHAELTRSVILEDPRIQEAEILAVAAPAGFGKSTFAIQWASRSETPVVWITLDETDSDALVLIATLVAGLEHAVPGYEAPKRPLTLEEPAYSRRVLPGFERSVAALEGPVTMVLDEVQLVTDEKARHVLKTVVNALPVGSRVALVGRSLKGLAVPLWRGQGRLADIGVRDLAFEPAETRKALESFSRTAPPQDVVQRVQDMTEGWPVAVFLLSQAGGSSELSTIGQFIEAEVLEPMPDDLRAFVCETAAIGTVNAELACAVTGQRRASHFLSEAITTVLLQQDREQWYRYHPLLQECATDLLAREDPDRLRTVRSRAALWHRDQGYLETSVRFALASGDWDTMGATIWPAARYSLLQGRTAAVRGWLDAAGEQATMRAPQLSLTAAWMNISSSDFGNVLRYAEATLLHMPGDWREDLPGSDVSPHLALLLAVTGYGLSGAQEAAELATAALAAMAGDDPTRALAGLIIGLNLALIGDPGAAEAMQRAAVLARSSGIASSEVEALALLGLVQMGHGQETAGCESIEAARTAFAFHDLGEMTSTTGILAIAHVAWTAFRARPPDVAAAIADVDRIRPALQPVFPWYRPLAGAVCAFASVRTSDVQGFHHYIGLCEDSDRPEDVLCRQWQARARQEYAAVSPLQQLSPAELRVWELLKGRMTLSEIAGALFLSRETVKSHTVAIYRKLGVGSRREAQDLAETWN